MTKRYDDAIEVMSDPSAGRAPVSFVWRGRRYDVDQRLATWLEGGEWWQVPGGSGDGASGPAGGVREREFHRLLARPAGALSTGEVDADGFLAPTGAVYDVFRDRVRGGWRMARVWD